MISGLYSAATAMDASTRRHEIASENLANVQMPGFRRRVIAQASFDTIASPMQAPENGVYSSKLLGTTTLPVAYDFTQGHFDDTGRPLDLALGGEGFFTVQGPDGPLYSRNGSFYVDNNRQLVTIDQLPVMGLAGPIVLPADASSESVNVDTNGRLMVNGQEFGQLAVVQFADNIILSPEGSSLFSADANAVPVPSNAMVLQGKLELANTSAIDEMVNLIAGSRQFEAAQKALNTIAESIQRRIGLR